MKRFYFLTHKGRVFALEPRWKTLLTIAPTPDPAAPDEADEPRLIKATPHSLGIAPGRRQCRRASPHQYQQIKQLLEQKLNTTIFPYTTPLPKPLTAYLAQEPMTLEEERQYKIEQRKKNTMKKKLKRERQRASIPTRQDEESE